MSSDILSTSYSKMTFSNTTRSSVYSFVNNDGTFNFVTTINETIDNGTTGLFVDTLNWGLKKIFEGNLTGGDPGSGQDASITTNQLMYGFNSSTDLPATMDQVALAMSTYTQVLSKTTVSGQLESTESYIHVTWAWIALPGMLIVCGVGCLVLAMIRIKQHGLHVWKSSEIALLFHGLNSSSSGESLINTISRMEEVSRQVEVNLAKDAEGRLLLHRKEK